MEGVAAGPGESGSIPGQERGVGDARGCAPQGMRCEPMPSPGGTCEGTAGDTLLLLHPGTRRIS